MKERLFTGHIHTENELTVNPHNLEIGLCTGDASSLAIWRSRHSNKQQGQRGGWEDDNGTVTLWKHEVKLFLGQSLHGEAF